MNNNGGQEYCTGGDSALVLAITSEPTDAESCNKFSDICLLQTQNWMAVIGWILT